MTSKKRPYGSVERGRTPKIDLTEVKSIYSLIADEVIEGFVRESRMAPRDEIRHYIMSHYNGCIVDKRENY